jgi:hypothetical protein
MAITNSKLCHLAYVVLQQRFQYLMDNVFAKDVVIQDRLTKFADFIASYMDDTFIFSDTIEEHIHHIIVSLNRLRQFGLYVKPSKCEWLQTASFGASNYKSRTYGRSDQS